MFFKISKNWYNTIYALFLDSSKLLASGPTSISSSSGKKPPIPPAEKAASKKKAEEDDGYIHMNPKEIEQARKADMVRVLGWDEQVIPFLFITAVDCITGSYCHRKWSYPK